LAAAISHSVLRATIEALTTRIQSITLSWLRSLAVREHARCGGPGVGAIGMCMTGGFALGMATDPRIVAPVLSQPASPASLSERHRNSIDCSEADLQRVAARCANEGLRVLGVRFHGDRSSPGQRFRFLQERLGDGFIAVELPASSEHPDSILRHPHSVLTTDLIDEPGEPTRAALDQVLAFFHDKLLGTPPLANA
jgi:dienelactone hydrolase